MYFKGQRPWKITHEIFLVYTYSLANTNLSYDFFWSYKSLFIWDSNLDSLSLALLQTISFTKPSLCLLLSYLWYHASLNSARKSQKYNSQQFDKSQIQNIPQNNYLSKRHKQMHKEIQFFIDANTNWNTKVNYPEEWVRLCDTLETKKKSPSTRYVA